MESRSIASNLVYQRKIKGYSQEELSARTNVTVRTIQRIEKGDVQPHLQTVKLLAVALDIEIEDLLVLDNPKEETIKKKWLLLLHATPILGLVIPFSNILIPLFLWIHKREDNPLYDTHGRAVVNFQITLSLALLAGFIALIFLEKYGFFIFISILPIAALIILFNTISAVNSFSCYYPLAIPFLRKKSAAKTNNSLLLLLMFAICLNSCTVDNPKGITRLDGTSISVDTLSNKIAALAKAAQVHGLAVAIFEDNQRVYLKSFGYRDFEQKTLLNDSTNIYGASFSKAVFSVLVMKLVEEGVLALDTPLESYLPKRIYEYRPGTRWHDDYAALRQDSLYPKITARMCLNHSSGFPNWRFFEPDGQLRVNFEPGTRYHYSGEGLVYLQVVLEKMLKKGLEELTKEKIFTPLEMDDSSYLWQVKFENNYAKGHNKEGKPYPKDTDNEPRSASTLETTATDYTKFLEAVFQQKILNKSSWKELFSPQIRITSKRQFGPLSKEHTDVNAPLELSYGLGWGLIKTPFGTGAFKEGHGDGFQHYSIVFPDAGKGVMLMTNSDNGEGIFKELLALTIADNYTPWEWQNYIPFDSY